MRGDSHTNLAIPGWLLTGIGTASLLGALLALGGCAVGPNFKKPPVSVNKSWSAEGDPRLTDQTTADGLWWKTFNDPVLDRLVDLAVKQNLPLQVAGLRILEARAQLGITSGNRWPQTQALTANAAAIGLTNQMKNVFGIDRTFFNYQIGFDAAWELDFWGKFRRNVEAQSAALLVTVADYYSAVVSLTAEVARTYALVRTYDVLVDQAELNVKLQEAGLQIADSRFRNGATSELDVAQATTLLESTRASIPQLQIQGRQSRNALSTLLGQTTGSVDAMLEGPNRFQRRRLPWPSVCQRRCSGAVRMCAARSFRLLRSVRASEWQSRRCIRAFHWWARSGFGPTLLASDHRISSTPTPGSSCSVPRSIGRFSTTDG